MKNVEFYAFYPAKNALKVEYPAGKFNFTMSRYSLAKRTEIPQARPADFGVEVTTLGTPKRLRCAAKENVSLRDVKTA